MDNLFYYLRGGENQFATGWEYAKYHPWMSLIIVVTSFAIFVGHLIIAKHKLDGLRLLPDGLPRRSLSNTMITFILNAICFLVLGLMTIFPTWYILTAFMVLLAISTWTYVYNIPHLRVVYEEVHDTQVLVDELNRQTEINKTTTDAVNTLSEPVDKLKNKIYFGLNEESNPKIIESINEIRNEIVKISKGFEEIKKMSSNGKS